MENKDLELLIEKIRGITDGDFTYSKAADYSDPEIAEAVNDMLNMLMHRNNHFLVRINDAMTRIADSSCVKAMLDEIDTQQKPIKILSQSAEFFNESKTHTESGGARVYAMSRQLKVAFEDYDTQCDDILKKLNNLLEEGEFQGEQEDAISDIIADIDYLKGEIQNSDYMMKDMGNDISAMYHAIGAQTEQYETMFDAMDSVTESFSKLFTDCLNVGSHLYRISRDIDNARNDMYRKNSWPFLHDKLKVFTVDHLTLTWRLYNHAVEYETLSINQINNPDGCKFGLWAKGEIERDSDISKSEAFKVVVQAHYELHDHAVSCFLLKESFKNREALSEFDEALAANGRFEAAMRELHNYLDSIGIMDETEVWQFEETKNTRKKL